MRRTISFFVYVFAVICALAQTRGPEFPGGEEKLEQFLKENVQYPYTIKSRKTYNVKAEVVVTKDGTVKFFEIQKPGNPKREIANETKRVIKMMPKWNPGGHYAADGTFVPEQWKTVINICFNPMNDYHEEMTCVNVEKAGTLESLLTQEQKDTCSQLRIMGRINSADIVTLRKMAGEDGCLEVLDLSGARIVASKQAYLLVEDAEKHLKLWTYMVPSTYSYTPGWIRAQNYEQDGNRNRSWGTPYQNKLYPSSPNRYRPSQPYGIPFRERTHFNGFRNSIRKWLRGNTNSYGQTAICLFEGKLGQVPNRKPRKTKPTHFKGHKLERKDDKYILAAYTAKNSFCQDMFYQCPKLKQVIVPLKASLNERSVVKSSNISYLEVRKPQY